jgi:hypothetical protein
MDVPPRDAPQNSLMRSGTQGQPQPHISLLPTARLQPDISLLHTTLLPPPAISQQPTPVMRDVERKIALHEAAALRFRDQADQLTEQVKQNAESFAAVVARWRTLTHQPIRTIAEAHELAQLERTIPALSQHLAGIRRWWTDRVAAARAQEDAAEDLRAQRSR